MVNHPVRTKKKERLKNVSIRLKQQRIHKLQGMADLRNEKLGPFLRKFIDEAMASDQVHQHCEQQKELLVMADELRVLHENLGQQLSNLMRILIGSTGIRNTNTQTEETLESNTQRKPVDINIIEFK